MKVSWDEFLPGDIAIWRSGSSMMSWPPDDGLHDEWRASGVELEGVTPKTDQLVFIVARMQYHGAIVLFGHRFWWCPLAALRGEPSGSVEVK